MTSETFFKPIYDDLYYEVQLALEAGLVLDEELTGVILPFTPDLSIKNKLGVNVFDLWNNARGQMKKFIKNY